MTAKTARNWLVSALRQPLFAAAIAVLTLFCAIPAAAQQAPETDQNQSTQAPAKPPAGNNPQATPAQQTPGQTVPADAAPNAQQDSNPPQQPDQAPKAEQPDSQPGQTPPAADSSKPAPNAPVAAPGAAAPAVTPAAAPPGTIELPTGTHLPLVLHNGVSTRTARVGDPVYFETLFPVIQDGKIIIPAGSYVSGEVTESKRPGRVKGRGELMLRLQTLILPNAYMVRFNGTPSNASTGGNETTNSEGKIEGDSNKKGDVGTVAKTTAAGAGIGGLATRTGAGVGIGAGAGLAAGLAAILLTRGPEAELPRGTTLDAILDRPLDFDATKITFTSPGQASTLAGPSNREPGRVGAPF